MIIDTHPHFGDPSRPIPALYRTEPPEVYKAVVVPEGVTGAVFMETQSSGVEEIEWVLGLAAEDPFFVGLVGDIRGADDNFAQHIDRFAENPIFSGIRVHGQDLEGDQALSRFIEKAERLVAHDLELDVHVGYEGFDKMFEIARRLPELRLVIDHIGECRPLTKDTPNPRWVEAMNKAAELPQTFCKVSAFVQMTVDEPAPTDVDFYRATFDVLWDAFGEDRLIYASNWPQIERVSDYPTVQRIVSEYFGGKGDEAVQKFFWKNAKAAYKYVDR